MLKQKSDKFGMLDKNFSTCQDFILSIMGDAGVKLMENRILGSLPDEENHKDLASVVTAVQQIISSSLFDFLKDDCKGRVKVMFANLNRILEGKAPKHSKDTSGFRFECYRRLGLFACLEINKGTDKHPKLETLRGAEAVAHQMQVVLKSPEKVGLDDIDILMRFFWLVPVEMQAEVEAVKEAVLTKESKTSTGAVKRVAGMMKAGSASASASTADEQAIKRAAKMFAGRA